MKKLLKFLLSFLSLVTIFPLMGQEIKTLSLSEVISLSVQNSKQLKLSKTQLEDAKNQIQKARNLRLPDFDINGQGSYLLHTTKIKLDKRYRPLSEEFQSLSDKPDYALIGRAALSVPLFSGFKITQGVAIAQYNQFMQKAQMLARKEEVKIQAVEIFINLYKTQQAIQVIEANLKRSEHRVKDFINYEKNGLVAKNDLLRVQLQESNVRLTLLQTQRDFKVINYNLNLLLGLPDNVIIEPVLDFNYQTLRISEADYLETAYQNRKEYKVLEYQNKIAERKIKMAQADYYPQIALTGDYTYLDIHKFGEFKNLIGLGIGIKYNLASLFKNKASVASTKNQKQQVADERAIFNDQVKSKIHETYQDYLVNIDKTFVYDQAFIQANENYRIVKNKYANGLANTDDLLTADVEQLQAAINQAYGKADVLLAYYELLSQAGIIPD